MWALALALREEGECRRCGGDLAETLDHEWAWKPQPPLVCLRCLALHQSEKQHKDHPEHAGMIHQVAKQRRPKPKPRQRG